MNSVIRENVPLAPMTTLQVGGPARYYAELRDEKELPELVSFARGKNLPIFVLGEGSNVLVSDNGFPGLVIVNRIRGMKAEESGDSVRVSVGAGEHWDMFVANTVMMGWSGLELLSGIPGTVGAAPIQNIGAYGTSADRAIQGTRATDLGTGEEKVFSKKECDFAYRTSVFKSNPGRYLITDVTFELTKGDNPATSSYPDIQKYFEALKEAPTIAGVRRAVLDIRAEKGMVIMPEHESYQSVGSFFTNPRISREAFERVKDSVAGTVHPWFWEETGSRVKVSAARLIEEAGFNKGHREGNVGISPKHTLAIVNLGGATANEIKSFAEKIQNAVKTKFGVALEPEAQLVGF